MMIVERRAGSSTQGISGVRRRPRPAGSRDDDRVLTIIEGEVLTPAFIEVVARLREVADWAA
jgi:hypothetical protein